MWSLKAIANHAVQDAADCNPDCLQEFTDQKVQQTATQEALKLHRELGHPSRQAFLKMFPDRGAGELIKTLASLVDCQVCHETTSGFSKGSDFGAVHRALGAGAD